MLEKVVMLNLIQYPKISVNSLKKLLNDQGYPMTYHQLSQILSFLHSSGVLRKTKEIRDPVLPGGKRLLTEVEGRYNPKSLGLIRQDLVFFDFPNNDTIERFFRICDLHPYTHYRTIYLDNGMNAYAQFDVPIDARAQMDEFYRAIQKELELKSFIKVEDERMSQSRLDLSYWSSPNEWDFAVFGPDSIEEFWGGLPSNSYYEVREMDPFLHKLDSLDFFLIRELTVNGKVRPVDIASFYKRDASTISRRMNKIEENVMGKPVLQYDRRIFDITVPLLIMGDAGGAKEINRFHSFLETNLLPFRSFMRSEKSKFIHVAWLPPSIAGEYGYFLWEKFKDIKFSFLYLTEKYSWVYPFYNLNFDFDQKKWRSDKSYLIDGPLTA
ncbi:MAG: hypothetical protein D6732_11005 [Methanobacteriota archaeon]|nr:MAG: hypothetical protein D6732_11005 [Euryarchaeota archaeon]